MRSPAATNPCAPVVLFQLTVRSFSCWFSRGGDDDAAIQTRLANAKEEIAYGAEAGNFELVVENGVLDDTVAAIANQLRAWYPHLQN